MAKVEILINLGNYENIKIISNEYDDINKCLYEVINFLIDYCNDEYIDMFLNRVFIKTFIDTYDLNYSKC
ncbi:MAG: hypothetical protein ACP6IY_22520 [Promethearchaeia archaeon]